MSSTDFSFAMGTCSNLVTEDVDEHDIESTSESTQNPILYLTERTSFFKLSETPNVPRGAPDRLPTAYGSLSSAKDHWNAALAAEESAKRKETEKEARREARKKSHKREQPLIDVLVKAGFMKKEERLVKATILKMLVANKVLANREDISSQSSRAVLIDALLKRISTEPFVLKSN